jgi:hypothetical protein
VSSAVSRRFGFDKTLGREEMRESSGSLCSIFGRYRGWSVEFPVFFFGFEKKKKKKKKKKKDSKFDSDLAELENITFLSVSKSVQKGTISSDDVCKSCGEVFSEELERKCCSNCLKDYCLVCMKMVKLETYKEKVPRLMCCSCIEEVKQKIMR